jgi:D-alanyl-D-alanine carboxypeptidase
MTQRDISRRSFLAAGGTASLAALLAACGSSAAPDTPPTTASGAPLPVLNDTTRSALDRIMAEQFAATGLAGLAGVVRIGGDVWTSSTGVADLATKAPFRAGDQVRIASITKSFTGTAVLQLIDAGTVRLDDKLEKYVPGVINGKVATITDLLGMRSGIPDFTANDEFGARFTADPTLAWSDSDTLAVIAESQTPDFAPGEKVAYCDSNYALLGMVIAAVTGATAGEWITKRIIEPLG